MTVDQIAQALNAKIVINSDRDISEFYAGDFISRVIAKAPQNSCWLTVMNNINVAGAAVMGEICAIVLCEGVLPNEMLKERCSENGIALLCTELDVFGACQKL